MQTRVEEYWIRFLRDDHADVTVGKWVVFFRRNFVQPASSYYEPFLADFRRMAETTGVEEALISRSRLDVAVFFTSADREEIWRVGEQLKAGFHLRPTDLFWNANFETDNDWVPNRGPLWLLNGLEEAISKHRNLLMGNNPLGAEKVRKKQIEPGLIRIRQYLQEQKVTSRRSLVITPSFQPVDYAFDPDLAFVLMPFTEKWSDDLFHVIKQVCQHVGMRALRADDIFSPEIIINDIWRMISSAGVVIADITVHNANVFYELGIAHTLGKRVVLLRQATGATPPFDIAFWRHFEYGLTPLQVESFRLTLQRILETHRVRPPERPPFNR